MKNLTLRVSGNREKVIAGYDYADKRHGPKFKRQAECRTHRKNKRRRRKVVWS